MNRKETMNRNRLMTPEIIKKRIYENKMKKIAENARIKKEKIENMLQSCEDKFILKICQLFINRWDCYAIQDNTNPLLFPTVYQDLTIDIIKDSINPNTNITIGIHQINDNKVKWLCYDIDKKHTDNPKLLSDQIIKYLKEWYNLHGYLEPSGSPDSYHVWIFIEPTDVNIAINFHKDFKDRLKSVTNPSVEVKAIEKGISKGDRGLGCMIKLPFNIQRKTNNRSELIADIFTIIPDKLTIDQNIQSSDHSTIYHPLIRKVNQSEQSDIQTDSCVLLCVDASEDFKDSLFKSSGLCNSIISGIPEIIKWLEYPKPDRSKLDFMIIKALVSVGISKKTIYKYLLKFPSSKTKIHDRGYSYFELTYYNAIKANNRRENGWHAAWKKAALRLGMKIETRFDPGRGCVADIYDPKRRIVTEIQHASIPPEIIINRCSFYESNGIKIRWIFDYREKYDTNHLRLRIDKDHHEGNVVIWQICPRNMQCLFDDMGNSKYDIYYNIEYNFSDDTHTTLKIKRISEDGTGYGELYSSIHKPEIIKQRIKQIPFGRHI